MLEFNLSQFTALADLVAAFHRVRDVALSGAVPLVFLDEFDTVFGGELGWLRYFLAPMQDGVFREGGEAHPLGQAILVFAGGTRPSFAAFAEPMDRPPHDPERRAFTAAKGPDFASRLRGYVDIHGPDPIDANDTSYPIRRAFLLRALLERTAPHLKTGERMALDEGVLNALLTVPSYRHGVRSMEAVLAMSTLAGRRVFGRADLPPKTQLALHVDAEAFMDLVVGERLPDALRDALGRLLHDVYRAQRRSLVETAEEGRTLTDDSAMHDWEHLDPALQESSRQPADDIPAKLRRIGCFMAGPVDGRAALCALTPAEITLLGEREHERWNTERLRDRWQLDDRDPDDRRSPFLVPWRDLAPKWRSLDEAMAAAIPAVMQAQGIPVYRMNANSF